MRFFTPLIVMLGGLLSLSLSGTVRAAPAWLELSPGARYDTKIPSLKQVLGHDFAEKITTPEEVGIYLRALAAAVPGRARLIEYARSWEGRPLWLLIIASPDRIGRLEQVKADRERLRNPSRLSPAEIDRLVRDLPVVTALLHSVHGNEISGVDAALAAAYHLLAAQGDANVDLILRESVVLIDPMQNPDGRARFLASNALGAAAAPDAEPNSAEHDEPWPGGRSNHYLFDLNRDWFAQNHPETVGRVRFQLEWLPQVVVDLHEMGGEASYYFPPTAAPLNPYLTSRQRENLELFGRENAARFDERGFPYFIREVFDAYYPGYGCTWPLFYGAIGQTFEMAGSRGLIRRRRDGTALTYRDGVVRHFTAAITTATTAARHRDRMLRDFLDYRRSAVTEGAGREYLLVPGHDRAAAERLARLLLANSVEVRRAEEPFTVNERRLPPGAFLVALGQPSGRLVRNLLDPDTPMDAEFLAEQERRRKKRLPGQIYDVTGWSLPLLYDVDLVVSDEPVSVRTTRLTAERPPAPDLPPAKVGYLLPWGSGTAAAITEALQAGVRVRSSGGAFRLAGRRWRVGTALVRTAENDSSLLRRLGEIAARAGAEVVPIDSAFVDEGISLGSSQVAAMRLPRVLLAWDSPASSLSAGWARFVLERRYGQPVTAVRTAALARVDWGRYDVLVLPSGTYTPAIGDDLLRRLKDWIRAGGTLITLAEASRWASGESVGLLSTRTELRDGRPDVPAGTPARAVEAPVPFDPERAIQPERERPDAVPGAVLRVTLDTEHWLSAGTDGEVPAMVSGNRVFAPIRLDRGRNVGAYASKERLLASGHLWDEARDQLPYKAYLIHQPLGQGHIVAFAEDPNWRAFAEATELLFMNAVLLGPARAGAEPLQE